MFKVNNLNRALNAIEEDMQLDRMPIPWAHAESGMHLTIRKKTGLS